MNLYSCNETRLKYILIIMSYFALPLGDSIKTERTICLNQLARLLQKCF